MRRLGMLALAAALLAGAGCEDVHVVRIDLGRSATGLPFGFHCKDGMGNSLLQRALGRPASIRIDYLTVGGSAPSCRLAELAERCMVPGRCVPVGPPDCVDVPDLMDASKTPQEILAARIASTKGKIATENAPSGVVIVRAVGVAQPCDPKGATPAPVLPDRVVGCAYSCPVQLDGVVGEVQLDLPVAFNDMRCAALVEGCRLGTFSAMP